MSGKKDTFWIDLNGIVHLVYNHFILIAIVLTLGLTGYVVYDDYLAGYYRPMPDKPKVTVAVAPPTEGIVNGIDVATGFIAKGNWEIVKANCTSCHSAMLVTQNRQTRAGWKSLIAWMQETQGLWDLGENESLILDYLSTYYAPEDAGRRMPLKDIEWYVLDVSQPI